MPCEASPYVAIDKLPSDLKQPRDWQRRPDPSEEHWPESRAKLATPELEAKTLFELLQQQPPLLQGRQLRTLHRHVKRWRADHHGSDREVVLAQQHRSGKGSATDFTHATARERRPMSRTTIHVRSGLRLQRIRCTLQSKLPFSRLRTEGHVAEFTYCKLTFCRWLDPFVSRMSSGTTGGAAGQGASVERSARVRSGAAAAGEDVELSGRSPGGELGDQDNGGSPFLSRVLVSLSHAL